MHIGQSTISTPFSSRHTRPISPVFSFTRIPRGSVLAVVITCSTIPRIFEPLNVSIVTMQLGRIYCRVVHFSSRRRCTRSSLLVTPELSFGLGSNDSLIASFTWSSLKSGVVKLSPSEPHRAFPRLDLRFFAVFFLRLETCERERACLIGLCLVGRTSEVFSPSVE